MSRVMNRAVKRSLQSEYRRQTQRRTKQSAVGRTRAAQASGGSAVTIAGQTFSGSGIAAPAGSTVAVKNIGRLSNALYVPDRASSVAYSNVNHSGGGGGAGGASLTAGAGLQIIGSEISLKPVSGAGIEASVLGVGVNLRSEWGLEHHADGIFILRPADSGLNLGAGGLSVGEGNGIDVAGTLVSVKRKATSGLALDATGLGIGQGAGITVSTDFIAINLKDTNPGLSLAGGELALGAPGTLTYNTGNSVTNESHFHDITTSATVGQFPATVILHADAGNLELAQLSLYGDLLFKGAVDRYIRADESLYLRPDTHLVLDPGGPTSLNSLVLLGSETTVTETPGQELRTPVYSDSITGIGGLRAWDRGGNVRQLTIGAIKADELFVRVFTADEARVNRGEEFWSRSFGIVETAFEVPAIGIEVPVWFEEAPGLEEFALFAAGNWIQIRSLDWEGLGSAGPMVVQKIWFKVVLGISGNGYEARESAVAGSETVESKPSRQLWRLVRMSGGFTGTTIKPGTVAVDFGKPNLATGGHANLPPGQGVVYLSALAQDNGPFIQIETFKEVIASVPQFMNRVRMGNLNGVLDYTADTYGLAAGSNLSVVPSLQYADFQGFTVEEANGLRMFNTDIRLYESGILAAHMNQDIGLRFLHDTMADRVNSARSIGWHANLDALTTPPYTVVTSYTVSTPPYAGTVFSIDASSPTDNDAAGSVVYIKARGYANETAHMRLATKPYGSSLSGTNWDGTWGQIFADQVHLSKRVLVSNQASPLIINTTGALSTLEVREMTSAFDDLAAGLTISQYGSGDATLRWRLPTPGIYFTMGIDNSDRDILKISRSSVLGTQDLMNWGTDPVSGQDRVQIRGRTEVIRTGTDDAILRTYGWGGNIYSFYGFQANGTEAVPTRTVTNDIIVSLAGTGRTYHLDSGVGGYGNFTMGDIILVALEDLDGNQDTKGAAEWRFRTRRREAINAPVYSHRRLTLGPDGVDVGVADNGNSILRFNNDNGVKFTMELLQELDGAFVASFGTSGVSGQTSFSITQAGGDMTFHQQSSFQQDVTMSEDLYVSGQVRAGQFISLTGAPITIAGDVVISGTMTVDGIVYGSGSGGGGHDAASGGDGIDVSLAQVVSVDSSVVRTSRTITAGLGLEGGGNLTANVDLSVLLGDGLQFVGDAIAVSGSVVRATRSVIAGAGLIGGGTLGGDVTLTIGSGDGIDVGLDNIAVDSSVVRTSRSVTAGDGLSGGGTLGTDLVLHVAPGDGIDIVADMVAVDSSVVRTSRLVSTSGALSGGGNLTADRAIVLNVAANSGLYQTDFLGINDSIAGAGLGWSLGIISVGAGFGIETTANDVAVKLPAASGLAKDATGLYLADSVAGAGLTIASKVLAVGAGYGLATSADAVLVVPSVFTDLDRGLLVIDETIGIVLASPSGLTFGFPFGLALNDSVAGDGLAINSKVLSVNVKEGIETDADALRVDLDFAYNWTGAHTHAGNATFNADATFNTGVFRVNTNPQLAGDINFIVGSRQITTAGSDHLTVAPGGDLVLDPGGLISIPDAQTIRTATFTDAPTGITGFSMFDRGSNYRQMTISAMKLEELYTRVFIADEVRISRGESFWSKSYGVVETDFVVPAIGATVDVWFEDAPGLGFLPIFETGDWILLRPIDWSASLTMVKTWFQVTSIGWVQRDATNYRQQWTLERMSGGTTGMTIGKGEIGLDAGAVGQGQIHLSALEQDGGPFIQMGEFSSVSADVPQFTNYVRMGNLINTVDYTVDTYGMVAGTGAAGIGTAISAGFSGYTVDAAQGLRLFNTEFVLYAGGEKITTFGETDGIVFKYSDDTGPLGDKRGLAWTSGSLPSNDNLSFIEAWRNVNGNFLRLATDNSEGAATIWMTANNSLDNKAGAITLTDGEFYLTLGQLSTLLKITENGRMLIGHNLFVMDDAISTLHAHDNTAANDATIGLTVSNSHADGNAVAHFVRTAGVTGHWTVGLEGAGIISGGGQKFVISQNYDLSSPAFALTQVDGTTVTRTAHFYEGDIRLHQAAVAHGLTSESAGMAETDVYGRFRWYHPTMGGLMIEGATDDSAPALQLRGIIGSTDPTDNVSAITLTGAKKGTTSAVALGNDETVLSVVNWSSPLITVLGDGRVGIGDRTDMGVKLTVFGDNARGVTATNYLLSLSSDNTVATALKLQMGLYTSSVSGSDRAAFIQSVEEGLAFRNLFLNPSGGNVIIGSGTMSLVAGLNVHAASILFNLEATTAATYTSTAPNGNIVFNSVFTGQAAAWNNARIKWGFTASYASYGAVLGFDILNAAGNWQETMYFDGTGAVNVSSVIYSPHFYALSATTAIVRLNATGSGGRNWYWGVSATGSTPVGTTAGDLYLYDAIGGAAHSRFMSGGHFYVVGNVSALSFTDRTPGYVGDALAEIAKIRTVNGELDHTTLPAFARKDTTRTERKTVDGQEVSVEIVEPGRDLGAMISMLTVAVQQLSEKMDRQGRANAV